MVPGVTPGMVGARDMDGLRSSDYREAPLHRSEWTKCKRALPSCQSSLRSSSLMLIDFCRGPFSPVFRWVGFEVTAQYITWSRPARS